MSAPSGEPPPHPGVDVACVNPPRDAGLALGAERAPLMQTSPIGDGRLPPVSEVTMFKRILVPLDGSTLAELALPKAVELAKLMGAEITLVRAVEASVRPGADRTAAEITAVRDGEVYLDDVVRRLAREGVPVHSMVWYGPAVFAITEAVRLGRADAIVMGTHGRSGLGRLVVGSIAEAVLRRTTVPILLVRAAEAPLAEPLGGVARPRSLDTVM